MRVIIVGGGRVGRDVATRLENRGENVVVVERSRDAAEELEADGFTVHHGDGTDSATLRDVGIERAETVIAVTGDDDVNLLVAQLAASKFDVDDVVVRVNNPPNVEAFEELGVRAISANDSVAWALDNAIERPALANWMTELGRSGDVQEIAVTADDLVGMTIDDLDRELPEGVIIALAGRDGDTRMPDPEFTLRRGDHLTFLGRKEPVRAAIERCHPEKSD